MGDEADGTAPDDERGLIEAHLISAADQLRERDHLLARERTIRTQIDDAQQVAAERRWAVAAGARSVDQLSSFSLTRILAGLRGTRDADLGRATAEQESRRYLLATADARVASIESSLRRVQADLATLGDVDSAWTDALAAKEEWVLTSGSPSAARLTEIAERRGLLQAELRESGEAILAGQRALRVLHDARRILGSADSWSAWDTWFGGGLLVTALKHDRLDDAAIALRHAEGALSNFQSEVADIGRTIAAHLDLTWGHRALDLWFDNIFTDLSVRRRIKDAQQSLDRALDVVDQALAEIEARLQGITEEKSALRAERARLLAPRP